MDEAIKWIQRAILAWSWLAGVVAGVVSAVVWYRRNGLRLRRSLRMSDRLHDHFGREVADKVIEEFDRRSRDGRIRELRQQFVESRLGLALYICSGDGACEYVNDALADLFGLERVECLGNDWLKAIAVEQRQSVLEMWNYAVKNHMPYDYEYEIVHPKTKKRTRVITKAFPVMARDGKLLCYVGIVEKGKLT